MSCSDAYISIVAEQIGKVKVDRLVQVAAIPSSAVGVFIVAHLAYGWGSSWPNPHVVSAGS